MPGREVISKSLKRIRRGGYLFSSIQSKETGNNDKRNSSRIGSSLKAKGGHSWSGQHIPTEYQKEVLIM